MEKKLWFEHQISLVVWDSETVWRVGASKDLNCTCNVNYFWNSVPAALIIMNSVLEITAAYCD